MDGRIENIRARAQAVNDALMALRAPLRDSYLLTRLAVASDMVCDVDHFFQAAPPAQPEKWLAAAETVLTVATQELEAVSKLIQTHGPNIRTFPRAPDDSDLTTERDFWAA